MANRILPILAGLLLALPPASAAPETSGPIRDKELEPLIKELHGRVRMVRQGKAKSDELQQAYSQLAGESGNRRQDAIHAYVHGYLLHKVFQRDGEARREFMRALALYGDFPAAHVSLASIALEARDVAAARKHLDEALRINPNHQASIVQLAVIALARGELEEAERLFKRSWDIDVLPEACIGLQDVYVRQWRHCLDEKQREQWATKAIGAARVHLFHYPKSGAAHIFLAKAYRDVGQEKKAIETLEEAWAKADLDERFRRDVLLNLQGLYARAGDWKAVENVFERLLQLKSIQGADRDRIRKRLADLREKGPAAFVVWQVETLEEVLKNEGISDEQRVEAVRALADVYRSDLLLAVPALRPLGRRIVRAIFRSLVRSSAPVCAEVLRILRTDFAAPGLIRLVVHFVYPYDDAQRTPAVRKEAVRTLAEVGGDAALPTLFYCLNDADGGVVRELDRALSRLCECRSPFGGGIEPLDEAQIVRCRRFWLRYARGEEGAARLASGFDKLTALLGRTPGERAGPVRSAPLVDHTVSLVLLDDDMPWAAWKAAYEFLVAYWAKDFRPVERRGKPVREDERTGVVKALDAVWSGRDAPDREPEIPGEAGDEKGKTGEKNG